MKAKLYKLSTGNFELVSADGTLHLLIPSANGFVSRTCGKISANWKSAGRSIKTIPAMLKKHLATSKNILL